MPQLGCRDSIGFLWLNCGLSDEGTPQGKCYVDHIAVDARFRGRGIGKVLLEMAEIDAKRRGCRAIYLWVATSNRAQHLYERQGYRKMEQYSLCGLLWCQTGEKEFARMEKILM
ncbi:mycothiol acetyltransferase-like [Saccostrea cucullata]|uniref:mycothiol acetyltransferase-like n=1 Tax=Saccostrea cuccullata TaxID=36930 RepID=UPI002ED3D6E5